MFFVQWTRPAHFRLLSRQKEQFKVNEFVIYVSSRTKKGKIPLSTLARFLLTVGLVLIFSNNMSKPRSCYFQQTIKKATRGMQVLHSLPGQSSGCHLLIPFLKRLILLTSFSLSGIKFHILGLRFDTLFIIVVTTIYSCKSKMMGISKIIMNLSNANRPCISSVNMFLYTLNN